MSHKEVPPRRRKEPTDGFRYVREQKLPASMLGGANPMYAAKQQLQRFAPDASYELDKDRSDEMFNVYKVPVEAHDKMTKGLQDEANSRMARKMDGEKMKTAAGTKLVDKTDIERSTLNELGLSLPGTSLD